MPSRVKEVECKSFRRLPTASKSPVLCRATAVLLAVLVLDVAVSGSRRHSLLWVLSGAPLLPPRCQALTCFGNCSGLAVAEHQAWKINRVYCSGFCSFCISRNYREMGRKLRVFSPGIAFWGRGSVPLCHQKLQGNLRPSAGTHPSDVKLIEEMLVFLWLFWPFLM